MNDDGVIAMAFKILVRLLTASPLSALAFGLLVLISGSAVCECYMITLGRGTDAYYPWMLGTFVLGVIIWCAFLWRCLDFRWWSYSGWRFKLMTIRPAWLMGFLFSTFICIYVLTSVLEIECAYVKEDPAEFVMNMEVFGKIMRICGRIFREVLFNAAIVAVVSLFALFDDERRDKLADHIDQPRRCPGACDMIATLNYRRGRRFDAAAEVPQKGRILRRRRVISEAVNTSKCAFGIIRTMRRILVYFWLMFALQSAIAVGVDVSGDSAKACPMPGGPFVNEERARVREDRLRALEEARRPLIYDLPPGSEFELFGYVMGQVYQPAPSGHVVVYGDRVNRYIPTYPLPKKFHGMDDLSCQLTPISRRLYSMSLSRRDFSGRANLMSEGVAVLESLGEMLGHELAPFKYEAPDPPYWPCGDWSGPLPDLFVADENQWATSKNVFAVSNTRIGGVLVSVKLEVVSFDRFNMSIAARDDALASESQREFEEDFKKHHEGKTFAEWSQECSFKRSPAYKKNQNRAPLPDDFKIAGHFLGELIPPVEFAERFGKSVFYVRETNTRLSEKFLGVFSRIGIVTNSIGRVSRIVLASDIMTCAEQALEKYKVAREFLLSHGIDDYYEESIGKAQEIQDYYEPEGNCWAQRDFCALKWIDKSKNVWIELALHVSKTDGMKIYLEVKHVAQDSWTDYQWRRGLDKIRNGKRQE